MNVQDLNISGADLPIVIDSVKYSSNSLVKTYNFTNLTQNRTYNLSSQCLIIISEYNGYYIISTQSATSSGQQVTITYNANVPKRYYIFDYHNSNNTIDFYSGEDLVFKILDYYNNGYTTDVTYYKTFIEFNWGN